MNLTQLQIDLNQLKNNEKKKILERFFKCGKGQYGEGDEFLGIVVPKQREIVKKYDLNLEEIEVLLKSKFHEYRLVGLLSLVKAYSNFEKEKIKLQKIKSKDSKINFNTSKRLNEIEKSQKEIVNFYLENTKYINNWDLVDLSTGYILGKYLINKKNERKILYNLANSKKEGINQMWEKRIAIVATLEFIRKNGKNDLDDSFKLAKLLLDEKHDLMHKAVGWVLRETGKKDEKRLKDFLIKNYTKIPRTTLRYAIEKFDENKRKEFLNKKV
ncbi:MAG: DNA alkylation repair protein [Candidatus ainarchaeum sp.]|nr:DNA alkylation repair protein [Candidatus ainarchaeum sp.]